MSIKITHIEIRRVQNGFVVFGINMDMQERFAGFNSPQRVSFVADSAEKLGRLIESLATEGDFAWQASADIPISLVRREAETEPTMSFPPTPAPVPYAGGNPFTLPAGQIVTTTKPNSMFAQASLPIMQEAIKERTMAEMALDSAQRRIDAISQLQALDNVPLPGCQRP